MGFPRFRFSLLVLLLTFGVIAGWLGYQRYIMDQRRAALVWIKEQGGFYSQYALPVETTPDPIKAPAWYLEKVAHISSFRTWLGDRPMYYITLVHTDATWEERQRIARLFPEANVVPEEPEGFHRGDNED